jgi:excisionase family DNA binding protein
LSPDNHWLDRQEAADYARVSLRQIDNWVREGRLKTVTPGRRRLTTAAWLDACLKGLPPPDDDDMPATG